MLTEKDYLKIVSIYSRKYWQYYSVARRITSNKMLADDIVQGAFQYVLEHYEEKRNWKAANLERYIMAIVRNNAQRALGEDIKEKRNIVYFLLDDCTLVTDEPVFLRIERQCDRDTIRKALGMLHPRNAEYLILYYVKRYSDWKIAELMHIKRKSVPVLRYRAKKELRHILIKMEESIERS